MLLLEDHKDNFDVLLHYRYFRGALDSFILHCNISVRNKAIHKNMFAVLLSTHLKPPVPKTFFGTSERLNVFAPFSSVTPVFFSLSISERGKKYEKKKKFLATYPTKIHMVGVQKKNKNGRWFCKSSIERFKRKFFSFPYFGSYFGQRILADYLIDVFL